MNVYLPLVFVVVVATILFLTMRLIVAPATDVVESSVRDPLNRMRAPAFSERFLRVRARGARIGLVIEPGLSPAGRSINSVDKHELLRRRNPRISARLLDEYTLVGGIEMLGYITVPGPDGSWNAPREWLISCENMPYVVSKIWA